MKNKPAIIILIVILSVITCVLLAFFIRMLTNSSFRNFNFGFSGKISSKLSVDKTFSEMFDKIEITASASDVKVKTSNDNEIRVLVYEDNKETEIETINNRLVINSKKTPCIGFCFNRSINRIEIYLPSSFENEVKISNDYGDVEIENIYQAIIKNGYGDIEVDEAKKLDIEADCGDVKVIKVDDIKVVNKFGDIEIRKVNNYLDIVDDCGDIKIKNLDLKKNSTIKNSLGDIEIGFTNQIYINAKTSLGDTKINNNYPKSDVTLTITNSCGDIEVEN